jgi:hypothetical protein
LLIGARGAAALTCYSQKFFGSFLQKRTAFFPALPRPAGFTQNGASSWSPRQEEEASSSFLKKRTKKLLFS